MKTSNHIKSHLLKGTLTISILLSAMFQSGSLMAQGLKYFARKYQIGFEGSFGIKSFDISSNIAKIDGLDVLEEGGTIGVVAGNGIARLRLKQGFYYSSATVAQTVDEIRSSLGANIYPLQPFSKNAKLAPYITMSMERNLFKMYGFYGNEGTASTTNYSVSEAPFLGKISTVQASVGAGLEYQVKTPGHYVNFFGEVRYGKNIRTITSNPFFNETSVSGQMAVSLGISYGYSM